MVLQTGSQFTRFGQTALTGDVWPSRWCGIGTYADGFWWPGARHRALLRSWARCW